MSSETSKTPTINESKIEMARKTNSSSDALNFHPKFQGLKQANPAVTEVKVNFVSALPTPNLENMKLLENPLLNQTDKTTLFKKKSSEENAKSPEDRNTHKNLVTPTNFSSLKQKEMTVEGKTRSPLDSTYLKQKNKTSEGKTSSNLDSYDSLHGGSQGHPPTVR